MSLALGTGNQPNVTDPVAPGWTRPVLKPGFRQCARRQATATPAVRAARGRQAQRQGLAGEARVAQVLLQAGWHIHGQRLRTAAGEVDIVAERDGLLTLVEVKSRGDLRMAAASISPRQQQRLLLAGAILQGENPHWGPRGMRFDAWFVAPKGQLHHVPDAFREMG
jgi:putative endonuclease